MMTLAPSLALLLAGASIVSGKTSWVRKETWNYENFQANFGSALVGSDAVGDSYPNPYTQLLVDGDDYWDTFYSTGTGDVEIGVGRNYPDNQLPRDGIRIASNALFTNGLFLFRFNSVPGKACGVSPTLSFVPDNDHAPITDGITLMSHPAVGKDNTIHVRLKPLQKDEKESCKVRQSKMSGRKSIYGNDPSTFTIIDPTFTPLTRQHSIMHTMFAMQRSQNTLKIWSWPVTSIPEDVKTGSPPSPKDWGLPVVHISGRDCDLDERLSAHRIAFQIGYCGEHVSRGWGGECRSKTRSDSCPQHLARAVQSYHYRNSGWLIEDIKVYQPKDELVAPVDVVNLETGSTAGTRTVPMTVSGTDSTMVSGTESTTVSGTESMTVSETESATVSNTESTTVSGTESMTISETESTTVSGTESTTVSEMGSITVTETDSTTVTDSTTMTPTDSTATTQTDSTIPTKTDSPTSTTDSATITTTDSAIATTTDTLEDCEDEDEYIEEIYNDDDDDC